MITFRPSSRVNIQNWQIVWGATMTIPPNVGYLEEVAAAKTPPETAQTTNWWKNKQYNYKKIWIPMNKVLEFEGSETTNEFGGLYFTAVADQATGVGAARPEIRWISRFYYYRG